MDTRKQAPLLIQVLECMLPKEVVIFCLTTKRKYRKHASYFFHIRGNNWNKLQTNLTLDNEDQWNTVLH